MIHVNTGKSASCEVIAAPNPAPPSAANPAPGSARNTNIPSRFPKLGCSEVVMGVSLETPSGAGTRAMEKRHRRAPGSGWDQGAIFETSKVHIPVPAAPTAATRNQYLVPLTIEFTNALVVVVFATVTKLCGSSPSTARSTI